MGIYVYLWLIYVDLWQKPTQYCKVLILQLKINKFLKIKEACAGNAEHQLKPTTNYILKLSVLWASVNLLYSESFEMEVLKVSDSSCRK